MPLPARLRRAYELAEYVVRADPQVVLRIGEPAPGWGPAAFLTACNPRGTAQGEVANRVALERLRAEIEAGGWNYLTGEGREPGGQWVEPSFLVLGISREDATSLGRRFEQNALVYLERGGPAELVVLE